MMLYLGYTKQKVKSFDVQWFLETSKFTCISSVCLPCACLPAVRPRSAMCMGPIFLTSNVIGVYNKNSFWKRFIHCTMVIPFLLHWPLLFFFKVSNLRKKVLIAPDLYFPNYCATYLPHDISRDFKKCEHGNLRGEWTRVVFEELYYVANNQKIPDKKKVVYQKGLEKSRADNAARSGDSYMKDLEKSCARSCKSYMEDPEKSCVTFQHDAAKVTWGIWKNVLTLQHEAAKFMTNTWRRVTKMKLAWLFPTKVRKQLQSLV